jgi:multisubunit Na+/H+ antiporter MnhB subunit
VLGLAITGGVACASGTIWALALMNLFKDQQVLVLWVVALVGVFVAAARGRPRRVVAIAGGLLLPMGFVLFLFSMMLGGGDEPHLAFFLWALGAISLAVALRRFGRNTELGEQQRMWRRMAWAAAALVSLVAVFPPLRDAIFKRGETSELDEMAPTPRTPDDD